MTNEHVFAQIWSAIHNCDANTAQQLLDSVQEIYGNEPEFFYMKGMLALLNKDFALPFFEKAYDGLQNNKDFLLAYAQLLKDYKHYYSCLTVLGKLLNFDRENITVLTEIAALFDIMGNPISAINVLTLILKIKPNLDYICQHMGNLLVGIGALDEAIEWYKKALDLNPEKESSAHNICYTSNFIDMSREENFALNQKYRMFWESENPAPRLPFPNTEKIKVGFVSGDFHLHSVSYYVRGIFSNYDKSKFEIHLFTNSTTFDHISREFQNYTDKWHDITKFTYSQIADLVKSEEISVLIDLSGHTGFNCLKAFGFRPAPLQISYCGYPNTTGLKSFDYRISDNVCEPEDAQNFHSEKLYKFDGCFLCYSPDTSVPDCGFEDLQNCGIIFGSFNSITKYSDKTIRLWAKVVNSVPNAKLTIKHKFFNDPAFRELILNRFAKLGLRAEKISILGFFNMATFEHLQQYSKIDIALDSFPYNGTTTTCEALFMGVPVITILGDRHCSRVSASILNAVGHPELVAKDEEEFVEIAKNLALNTGKLVEIKQNLREKMKKSMLCDQKLFTKKFENAILDMINEIKAEENKK